MPRWILECDGDKRKMSMLASVPCDILPPDTGAGTFAPGSSGRHMAGVREACAAGEAAMRAVQAVRGEVAALQRQVVSVREVAVLKHSLEDEVTALRGEVAAVWEVAAMERSEVQRLTGKVADLKRDLAAVKAVLCSKEEDRSDMWHKILAASEETKLEPRNNQYATDAVLAHVAGMTRLSTVNLADSYPFTTHGL
ncbi:unnamed protein product [Closterium sp. NIES-64]|nr:unnamed protein product [Closterium sp. NIES-64]